MIQNWIITPGEQMLYKLAVYKNLTNGVIALQRAELQKVRLEIDRERLELLREKRRNKSASSSASPESSSAESASPSDRPRSRTPELQRSVGVVPPPSDAADAAQDLPPATAGPLPSPADAESLSGDGVAFDDPPFLSPGGLSPDCETIDDSQNLGPDPRPPALSEPPATPPNPVTLHSVPLWPNRRPGAHPHNATPRNPLGLL
jgi:hypothetical protein